jgi:Acetokinase family
VDEVIILDQDAWSPLHRRTSWPPGTGPVIRIRMPRVGEPAPRVHRRGGRCHGRVDALVFTGGAGENPAEVRERAMSGRSEWRGVTFSVGQPRADKDFRTPR